MYPAKFIATSDMVN